jgi:hypothetical protein
MTITTLDRCEPTGHTPNSNFEALHHGQIPGLLTHPRTGRVSGHPSDVQAPGAVLDEHQDIDPPEQRRSRVAGQAGCSAPTGQRSAASVSIRPAFCQDATRAVNAASAVSYTAV